MTTTIDNNQKVFMLYGDMNTKLFCNLKDLPECFNYFDDRDEVKIYTFWNFEKKRVSKKQVGEWLAANQIEATF